MTPLRLTTGTYNITHFFPTFYLRVRTDAKKISRRDRTIKENFPAVRDESAACGVALKEGVFGERGQLENIPIRRKNS